MVRSALQAVGWRLEDAAVTAFVGTSGWVYRSWRGRFYPADAHPGRWLELYARAFATVEVNATFYRLPPTTMVEGWAKRTPADFRFAVKMSRLVTHVRRLGEVGPAIETFLTTMAPLGPKLGPILLQLPPRFEAAPALLDDALRCFPPWQRVACEFRHDSWFAGETYRVLERHDAALCLADRDGEAVAPLVRTARWGYARFHAGRGDPYPAYAAGELERWADELVRLFPEGDLYLYFNNDPFACAPRDACVLADALRARGLPVTRTPSIDSIRVG